MVREHRDGSFDEEDLVREEGVLVSRNGGHEVGPDSQDRALDDYVEDPAADDGVPGTRDDLPYDFGVDVAPATDRLIQSPDSRNRGFGGVGETGADDDKGPAPLGARDERDLWQKQRPLIEESAAESAHLAGVSEAALDAVDDAQAEDAADPLPDFPEGRSATGSGA